jgi:hypothetical protein
VSRIPKVRLERDPRLAPVWRISVHPSHNTQPTSTTTWEASRWRPQPSSSQPSNTIHTANRPPPPSMHSSSIAVSATPPKPHEPPHSADRAHNVHKPYDETSHDPLLPPQDLASG